GFATDGKTKPLSQTLFYKRFYPVGKAENAIHRVKNSKSIFFPFSLPLSLICDNFTPI
ncbi:hypothetical protein HMPREF9554_02874, partial [Treponema phagedenis F0421]